MGGLQKAQAVRLLAQRHLCRLQLAPASAADCAKVKGSASPPPVGRTLRVAGAPAAYGERGLTRVFAQFGQVEGLHIKQERGERIAYVVFANDAALQVALRAAIPQVVDVQPSISGQGVELGQGEGLKGWVAAFRAKRPPHAVLQQQVDAFMTAYDAAEQKESEERLRKAMSVDEEGWTLVAGRKGRKKSMDGSGTVVGAVSATAAALKSNDKKEKRLLDFYRFQQREARRNELLTMRQKFEEDKRKIAKLKAARKFKPY
eukprot:jgi/Chlat1/639/Chrsp103S01047